MRAQLDPDDLVGYWQSRYTYHSSGREGEFTGEHLVFLHRSKQFLILESVPKKSKSYLLVRLVINDQSVTGTWEEETDPDGYYKGAIYNGAIQLVFADGGKRMSGKWVGFGKDGAVNTGPWEFTFVGKTLPEN